ncbi:Cation transport ATPase (plasmid) [Nostoc flagelliforme CCNUN1]|uniref:Cation transport ATPase n=1 Tax=Nostoc flagelliforme CCNUN1 TaxID=2038116 RepID=A0A2K8T6N3_9NOSO|nr:hypothetical protein [Nostoc flagelliforme]AUB43253.1 Cation transport ATPase [Nostoc flagelliforme CCNUN1]
MKSLTNIDYKIIHSTPGRIRVSVPQIKNNWEYASELEQSLSSLDFVVRVRLNPVASCVAIRYKVGDLSSQVIEEKIANCFRQLVRASLHQHNDKYILEKEPEENIPIGKISGELVGEIVGEFIGHTLLGSLGASIVSGVMGKAGEMLGESLSQEIADVAGLIEHLENQTTDKLIQKNTKFHQKKPQVEKSLVTGLSTSQLAILWQISSDIISDKAEQGATTFEYWSLARYGTSWTFALSKPTNSQSEKLFFPKSMNKM